jgi:hypothetical protein
MVYDRNGGSSDDGEAAPVAGGIAAGPFGPDNSSGTNSTTKTTRMIAPVSRSFTRSSKVGTMSLQSSDGDPRRCLVYAKPCQCRTHRVDRAEDDYPVTRNGSSLRGSAYRFHRFRESDPLRWQHEAVSKIRRSAATRDR